MKELTQEQRERIDRIVTEEALSRYVYNQGWDEYPEDPIALLESGRLRNEETGEELCLDEAHQFWSAQQVLSYVNDDIESLLYTINKVLEVINEEETK